MLDSKRLSTAMETRDRTYQLLLWISDLVDQENIPTSSVAHHCSGPEAATEWLRMNFYNIPESLRPDKQTLAEFGAFFSTYIISSFDVIEQPGTKGEGPISDYGCHCEVCLMIVNAPHLQAKKLYAHDKRGADELMADCLTELAKEHGITITCEHAMQIVANTTTRRAAGYLAYGHWLIKRLSGESDGPSILALWRIIAWDPRGGQIQGFELKLEDFFAAEQTLLNSLVIAK